MIVRGFQPGNIVPSPLLDRLELGYLSGLQDQRAILSQDRKRMAAATTQLSPGQAALAAALANGAANGMPALATTPGAAASTSTAQEDDQAIHNRCTWNNHFHEGASAKTTEIAPAPAPAKSSSSVPWVLAGVLLLALIATAGWAWYLSRHPGTTPDPVAPANPSNPTAPVATIPGRDRLDIQVIDPGGKL